MWAVIVVEPLRGSGRAFDPSAAGLIRCPRFTRTLQGPHGVSTDSPRREVLRRFQALADQLVAARGCSRRCSRRNPRSGTRRDEIKEVEHKCDFLTHEIIQRLNRTFVTPLDREDIHALAASLDDVMDAIDASATARPPLPARPVRFGARELARRSSPVAPSRSAWPLDALERKKGVVTRPPSKINRLENEADRVHQEAVRRLFDEERDPIVVMKWKEDARLPRGRHRPLRGRRQRPRRRRRQARVARAMLLASSSRSICVALVFDYINGFHDAANSIATVVSTRVLSPGKAVIWAAVLQFRRGLHVRHRRRQDGRLGDDRRARSSRSR